MQGARRGKGGGGHSPGSLHSQREQTSLFVYGTQMSEKS